MLAPFKSPRNVPYFSRTSIELTDPTHATDDVLDRILIVTNYTLPGKGMGISDSHFEQSDQIKNKGGTEKG